MSTTNRNGKDDMATPEKIYPGKLETWDALLAAAESASQSGEQLIAQGDHANGNAVRIEAALLVIAAQLAGLTQVLDKIAYVARQGSGDEGRR